MKSVELHLPAGSDPTGFPELIAVEVGKKLSVRSVRRSVERLFATGRLADVVVRTIPQPEGVAVIFELTPKHRIVVFHFQGNRLLSDSQILAASRLSVGVDFYPERIQQAVDAIARAYRQRGYEQVEIQTKLRQVPKGLELLFAIREGEPTRIAAINVAGTPGLPLNQILDALKVEVGSVLDLDRISSGLERIKILYRQERFYRARIGDPVIYPEPRGAIVALPILSGPRYEIRFRGNRSFRNQVVRAVLNYDGSETLDRGLVDLLARRLRTFYRYRGFFEAKVETQEIRSANQLKAVLVFEIEEGLPVSIGELIFKGNQAISSLELRQLLAGMVGAKAPIPSGEVHPTDDPLELEGRTASSARAAEPDPDPDTIFVEEAYQEAAESMTQLYQERGFLNARVTLANFEADFRRRGRVQFEVVEGVQTRVREIAFSGFPPHFDGKVEAIAVGDPLSRSAVERSRAGLLRVLGRKGYLFARIDVATELASDHRTAKLTFQLTSGPQVHVGQVIVQGLNRTHSEVVRANLMVRSGNVLDPEDLFETQRSLLVLGIFRQVAVHLISPEAVEPTKDVVVELKEMPRLDGNVLGGYSLVDGPQIGGDVIYPNLGGVGINLSARGRVNYVGASFLAFQKNPEPDLQGITGIGGRANIGIQNPRIYSLLPLRLGARLDLIGERVFRPNYRFTRFSAILGGDWNAYRWLTVSLQYEIEHDSVQAGPNVAELLPSLARADQERLRFPVGIFNLHSLRPSVALDFRDDVANPHKGLLISGFAEVTHDLGAVYTDAQGIRIKTASIFTLKVAGNVTFYVPLASRVVFALSTRAGRIFHLDPNSATIPPKRFFLGGAASMRGFPEDGLIPQDQREDLHQQVADCRPVLNKAVGCSPGGRVLAEGNQIPSLGGELFTLGKAELRFPGIAPFDFGIFFETGNLWLYPPSYHPLDLRYAAGAGIRYLTPIGPLALDLGFNLFPDNQLNEPIAQVHFSIGLF